METLISGMGGTIRYLSVRDRWRELNRAVCVSGGRFTPVMRRADPGHHHGRPRNGIPCILRLTEVGNDPRCRQKDAGNYHRYRAAASPMTLCGNAAGRWALEFLAGRNPYWCTGLEQLAASHEECDGKTCSDCDFIFLRREKMFCAAPIARGLCPRKGLTSMIVRLNHGCRQRLWLAAARGRVSLIIPAPVFLVGLSCISHLPALLGTGRELILRETN